MVLAHNINEIDGPKRTADVATDRDVTFESMLLGKRTQTGLHEAGFTRPSPVQLQGIPSGKCGFNLLLEAKSGTGKTAVFVVIALELLEVQADAQTLILAPTREIAAQITDVIRQVSCNFEDLRVEVVMGGLPIHDDIKKFADEKIVHIIVGSPGRLRHLIEEGHINTESVRLFVLDEADKLMEGSFKADINYIFSSLPNCKQVIMSSATYPANLKELVIKYMKKYIHICPNSTSVLLGIEQRMTVVKQHSNIINQTQHRYNELIKIFKSRQFKQCLIFCNYQARVVEVCEKLKGDKWPAQLLHGKQEQNDRLNALKTLQDYKCRILVSTDLAARGIDASNVDVVINFEIPYEWATYLHRIGRAGRYGSYGMAISIVAQGKEEKHFRDLLKNIGAPVNIKTLWTEEPLVSNGVDGNSENETILNENTELEGLENHMELSTEIIRDIVTDNNKETTLNDDLEGNIKELGSPIASCNNLDKVESFEQLMSSFGNDSGHEVEIPFATLNFNIHPKCIPKSGSINNEVTESTTGKQQMNFNMAEDNNIINHVTNSSTEECPTDPIPHCSKILKEIDKGSDSAKKNYDSNIILNEPVYVECHDYNTEEYCNVRKNNYKRKTNKVTNKHNSSTSSECTSSETTSKSSSECNSDLDEEGTDTNIDREILRMSEALSKQLYLTAAERNYRLWKRQLETRRAQIQLMLYIQELGKMNQR